MTDNPLIATGRAWVFGDDIDTDALAPGAYMKGPIEEIVAHCLESENPDFAANVRPGDILVGGANFGIGSSREQAGQVLRTLGVDVVVARSFAGLFYRNALNLGLVALACPEACRIAEGDRLSVDAQAGRIENRNRGEVYACEAIPEHLRPIIADGGLIPHLRRRFSGAAQRERTS